MILLTLGQRMALERLTVANFSWVALLYSEDMALIIVKAFCGILGKFFFSKRSRYLYIIIKALSGKHIVYIEVLHAVCNQKALPCLCSSTRVQHSGCEEGGK